MKLILPILLLTFTALHAQPSNRAVPAKLGGPGFEKIAASEGWKTAELSDSMLRLIRDERARKGGRVAVPINGYPATLRTMGKDENNGLTNTITYLLYESLIEVNPITLEFTRGLASHWKVDADGQTYYFRIDPRARFNDGTPVTSADVIATYDLGIDEGIESPYTNMFFQGYDRPVAISRYIVKVRSKKKAWKDMFYFGGVLILPADQLKGVSGSEYLDRYNYETMAGSGPYRMEPLQFDEYGLDSVLLVRRPDWWRASDRINVGRYNFDTICLVVVSEPSLELHRLRDGTIDYLQISTARTWQYDLEFDEIARGLIQKRRVFTQSPVGTGGFVFNMRKPPFDDPKVREAFILLFDREKIIDSLMYGQYMPLDSYYPSSVYENPNNAKYRHNPQRAAHLLAEAGYTSRNSDGILVKNGKPFVIEMGITEGLDRIISPVQRDMKKAGIDLRFEMVESYENFMRLNSREFTLAWINWGGLIFPNPSTSYHSSLADHPNSNNLSGFKSARADELIDLELETFEQSKRVEIIRELDSILMESKQYALSWYAPYTRFVYWNRFGHPDFYLGRISDIASILELWWVDPVLEKKLAAAKKDRSVRMERGEVDVRFW